MVLAHAGHWAVTIGLYVFPLVALAVALGVMWWRDRHRDEADSEPLV